MHVPVYACRKEVHPSQSNRMTLQRNSSVGRQATAECSVTRQGRGRRYTGGQLRAVMCRPRAANVAGRDSRRMRVARRARDVGRYALHRM